MRLPGKLSGDSKLVPWLNALRDALASLEIRPGVGYRVKQSSEGTILEVDARGGSGNIAVKLYDPAKACTAGIFYKIRSTDDAAVTGIEVSAGVFIKATPGKFLALKSVPANPTVSKHIPQLPDGSGQTDPAHADKYWEFFTPATACVDGATVEV